jgi:hypothetical protein
MAKDVVFNPDLSLDSLFPTLDDESFLQFLKAYYKWLQSSRINFIDLVPNNGYQNFIKNEIVVGQTSGAKGIIKFVPSDKTNIIIEPTTETPFEIREIIVGQTSAIQATISSIKDNVLRASARQQKNRNQHYATDEKYDWLKEELNEGVPGNTLADRRNLVNKIRDLYSSKSTEEAYRFLFQSFFGENIEFRFPGEELLRVSDGKFEKTIILRSTAPDNVFELLNQTITGETSDAVGNVVDIKVSFLGGIRHAELTLKLVSGTFARGEKIFAVDDPSANANLYGLLSSVTIVDGGSGYSVGDDIIITGDGFEAAAVVSSIDQGPITAVNINNVGHGYRLGTVAIVDNTGTGGENFSIEVTELANTYEVVVSSNTYTVGEIAKINIINRGKDYFKAPLITLQDVIVKDAGLLSERLISIANAGNNYVVGDTLSFTSNTGANAAGIVSSVGNTGIYGEETLLFEDGFYVIQETLINGQKSAIKNEDWTNLGPIIRIELSNFGDDYDPLDLPSVTVNTSTGSSANLVVINVQGNNANVSVDVANNDFGIGSIREVEIRNPGIDYSNASLDVTGSGDGNANLQAVISGISISNGRFLNDDGKVDYKIIQDSLFYQDFSYVIRSGLVIDSYKALVKDTIHPAGLEFFGEILISSFIVLSPQFYSQITPEKAPEIVFTLKSILSFYEAGVVPTATEIQLEITPDVFYGSLLDTFREVVVEMLPRIDARLNFIKDIPINRAIIARNISVELQNIVRELQKELIPSEIVTVDVQSNQEYVIRQQKLIESQAQIQTLLERSFPLEGANLTANNIPTSYTIDYELDFKPYNYDIIAAGARKYGEFQISSFANTQIIQLATKTFDTDISTTIISKNVKISGTGSLTGNTIVGVGTSFDSEFNVGDYVIVNDEKFVVKTVSNSEHMVLNVNSTGNYVDVPVYKEFIV